jgi:hypothetical protein
MRSLVERSESARWPRSDCWTANDGGGARSALRTYTPPLARPGPRIEGAKREAFPVRVDPNLGGGVLSGEWPAKINDGPTTAAVLLGRFAHANP